MRIFLIKVINIIPFILLILVLSLFLFLGENSIIEIWDNLEDHHVRSALLRNQNAFWGFSTLPFMGGISRNYFPSEFYIPTATYIFLPPFYAWLSFFMMKIFLGFLSMRLLLKKLFPDLLNINTVLAINGASFLFAFVHHTPFLAISLAFLPILVLLVWNVYNKNYSFLLFLAILISPAFFTFPYYGFFIICILALVTLGDTILNKRIHKGLVLCCVLFILGTALVEYRFLITVFSGEPSMRFLRGSVVMLQFKEIFTKIFQSLIQNSIDGHVSPIQSPFLLIFVCISFFFFNIKEKTFQIPIFFQKLENIVFLSILLCFVLGHIYRLDLLQTLLSKIKILNGFQLSRILWLTPFLWYLIFGLYLIKINKWPIILVSLIIQGGILFNANVPYNFLKDNLKPLIKNVESDKLSYRQFYDEPLFQRIKKDIVYKGEWAIAVGFHPAILTYNNISTLDGYLSYRPLINHTKFRPLITPELQQNDWARNYFDFRGIRAYVFSSELPFTYGNEILRRDTSMKIHLNIDSEYLSDWVNHKTAYIFSRAEITNYIELNLTNIGVYTSELTAFKIYLYAINLTP